MLVSILIILSKMFTYYSQNYASIIGAALTTKHFKPTQLEITLTPKLSSIAITDIKHEKHNA